MSTNDSSICRREGDYIALDLNQVEQYSLFLRKGLCNSQIKQNNIKPKGNELQNSFTGSLTSATKMMH